MKKFVLLTLVFGLSLACNAQSKADEKAIRATILNYVESFYHADTAKVYASVHPELAKRGYLKKDNDYRELKMTFKQMNYWAARWNKTNPVPKDAPKEITIFEIKDKIATAKVRAMWGTDYFHLVKQDGVWKIVNVLWQS